MKGASFLQAFAQYMPIRAPIESRQILNTATSDTVKRFQRSIPQPTKLLIANIENTSVNAAMNKLLTI